MHTTARRLHTHGARGEGELTGRGVDVFQSKLGGLVGKDSGWLESLPMKVQERVGALGDIQNDYDELEEKYQARPRSIRRSRPTRPNALPRGRTKRGRPDRWREHAARRAAALLENSDRRRVPGRDTGGREPRGTQPLAGSGVR
jgi:hypothetical protein